MRPIPAPRIGDSHGLLRAINQRERVRLDEFVTEFPPEELFPPELENALGRTRQFISYARAAGLLKEDRGTVELTEIGKRYVRAGDEASFFEVSEGQAEWLQRQLLEKHMTDSIYHGLAIGLSLLSSAVPGTPISTLDFGRSLGYLGRAGWDNDNTLRIQGERYLALLRDLDLIDEARSLTTTGTSIKNELTLPIHMSLLDIAGQLNPGGLDAVRAEGEAEAAAQAGGEAEPQPVAPAAEAAPAPAAAPITVAEEEEEEWEDVGPAEGRAIPLTTPAEPPPPPPAPTAPPAETPPPVAPAPEPAAAAPREPAQDAPTAISAPADAPAAREVAASPSPPAPVASPSPRGASGFLDAAAIRSAAEGRGLRLPSSVYANVAAALAVGKHVVLTGAPGAGKTSLALAIAMAAASGGRSSGAVLVTAAERWSAGDTLGRRPRENGETLRPGHVLDAARRGKWLIVDELDRAQADRALGALSTFLGGLPVTVSAGEEAAPPEEWRIVATAADDGHGGSPALMRRFAHVTVPAPADGDVEGLIREAAGGDEAAAGAARRLLVLRELRPLGVGIFTDAARHAAERNAVEPADERTLAREAYSTYVERLLDGLDDRRQVRLRELLGGL